MTPAHDAERALLGLALLSRESIALAGSLNASDFGHPLHAVVWEAVQALDGDNCPTDPVSVAERLERRGEARRFRAVVTSGTAWEGAEPDAQTAATLLRSWLTVMQSEATVPENAPHHARVIAERALLGRLREIGQQLAQDAQSDGAVPSDVIARADAALVEAASRHQAVPATTLRAALSAAIKRIEYRYDHKQHVGGVPSGIERLDEVTGGFRPGHLVIVAGRPGTGKTSLAMNFATAAGIRENAIPSLVFSLEMSTDELAERTLAGESRVNSWRLRTGFLDAGAFLSLTKGASRLTPAPVTLIDKGGLTFAELRSAARRWRMQNRAAEHALVIVDYLQLIAPRRGKGAPQNREQEIAEISRGLKALAKDLRLPVIALAQLNRGVESRADKRPNLSDLRESGAIEQDADLVLFIYRDDLYRGDSPVAGTSEIIVGKNRHGGLGTIPTWFRAEYTRFESMSDEEAARYVRDVSPAKGRK